MLKYVIEIKPRAIKDLKRITYFDREKVLERIEMLEHDLAGDVKKLTNNSPEYRMRYRHWRVLFEIDNNRIIIYRVLHRRESYR